MGFCNSADRDALEGLNKSKTASGGEALKGEQEEDREEEEIRLWEKVPCKDEGAVAMGQNPVEQDRDSEGNRGCKGEVVGALVVWMYGCGSCRVFYKGWNILNIIA